MRFVFLTLAISILATAFPAIAMAQNLERVTVITDSGRQDFEVEVARTDADRQQGLMYRRSMASDRGMLFDFIRMEPVSMWMKDTYLSLDMIFIRPNGVIANVAENTEPLSTRVIGSNGPVLGVLEVVAGTAKRLGIKAGDKVEHPLFQPR